MRMKNRFKKEIKEIITNIQIQIQTVMEKAIKRGKSTRDKYNCRNLGMNLGESQQRTNSFGNLEANLGGSQEREK